MVQYEDGGELDIRRSPMPIQSPKMLGEDSIDSILSIINHINKFKLILFIFI